MSTLRLEPSWLPDKRLWVVLALVLPVGISGNWAIAAGLTFLIYTQLARPFDFLIAFLVVVAGASFVTNVGAAGGLTVQLSMLSLAILLMLVSYAISQRDRLFGLSQTPLTWPLLAFTTLSIMNAIRGVLIGNHLRNLGLEFIALLALGTGLLVANAFERHHVRFAMVSLIVVGYATAVRGFFAFAAAHTRTASGYTVALPGIVGLLLINLALRAKSNLAALAWTTLSLPLFLHQLITFGRGLWTGAFAGLLVSLIVYAGWGRGSGTRWRRVSLVTGMIVLMGLVGAIQLVVVLDQQDLLQQAVTRVGSIASTKPGLETRSNMIRLFEYATVLPLILKSPWIGYGLGYTFTVEEPFSTLTEDQWGVHQNFLMVWLKQGVIGLVLFTWMLWAAVVHGIREGRRRADTWEATWFIMSAVATVFLAVFSLSNYPFAVVNETFLLALLWGGSMAMSRKGLLRIQWFPDSAGTLPTPAGGATKPSSGAHDGAPQ